jgi:hypothetical protein
VFPSHTKNLTKHDATHYGTARHGVQGSHSGCHAKTAAAVSARPAARTQNSEKAFVGTAAQLPRVDFIHSANAHGCARQPRAAVLHLSCARPLPARAPLF